MTEQRPLINDGDLAPCEWQCGHCFDNEGVLRVYYNAEIIDTIDIWDSEIRLHDREISFHGIALRVECAQCGAAV